MKTRKVLAFALTLVLTGTLSTPIHATETGWKMNNEGRWTYVNPDGTPPMGWQSIDECWYAFETNGTMLTGWVASDEKWYFMGESGVMQDTGWVNYEGSDYYLKGTGVMAVDFVKDGYELDSTGKAVPLSQTTSVELTEDMDTNNLEIEGNLYIDAIKFKNLELKGITVTGKLVIISEVEIQDTKITITDSNINTISSQARGAEMTLAGTTLVKSIQIEENSAIKPAENFTGQVETIEIQSTAQKEIKIDVPAKTVTSNTYAPVSINAPVDNLAVNKKTELAVNADVSNITVNKTASDTKVEVGKGNTVGSIESDTKIEVGGAGKVEDIKGDEIKNETEKPSKPSTGGGSGTVTPPVKTVINVGSKAEFDEALASSESEINIQLTANIDLGEVTDHENMLVVPKGKVVILDLKGFTISGKLMTDVNSYYSLQIIRNDGNLTINDSTNNGMIINTNENSYLCTRTIKNSEKSLLTLNSGEIIAVKGNALINVGKTVINRNAKLTSKGETNGGWDNAHTTIDNRDDLIINGGTFKSSMSVLYTNSDTNSTTITGGIFTSGDKGNIIDAGGGKFFVSGGEYNKEVNKGYITHGYSQKLVGSIYVIEKNSTKIIQVDTNEELITAIQSSVADVSHEIIIEQSLSLISNEVLTLSSTDTLTVPENVFLTVTSAISIEGILDVKGNLKVSETGYIGSIKNVIGEIDYEMMITNGVANVDKAMDMQWIAYLYMNKNNLVNQININADLDYLGCKADPIGNFDVPFTGKVQGNNHTISNFAIDDSEIAALFGSTFNTVFSDINVNNVEIVGHGLCAGVLSAYSEGNLSVENVNVQGSVYAESYYAGGLVGTISSDMNSSVVFKKCVTDIDVTSNFNIGSLFGTSSGSKAVFALSDCINTGNMNAIGTIGEFGGFVNCGAGSTYKNLVGIQGKKLFGTNENNLKSISNDVVFESKGDSFH